jgi:hypothetical protein
VDAPDGPAQEQKEGSLAWFGADELEEMKAAGFMAPMDYLVIEKYRQPGAAISYVEAEIAGGSKGVIEIVRFEDRTNFAIQVA